MKGQLQIESTADVVKQLDLAEAESHDLVGGKAWNLCRVLAEGLQVPRGFVIPVTVFHEFARLNRLEETLRDIRTAEGDSPTGWRNMEAAMFHATMEGELPIGFESSIKAGCELYEHAGATFAVRSSAVGEDSESAAFAGLLDTFTEIESQNVVHHVLRCWASYWSARALAYEHSKGISLNGMAVIVQQQIRSRASGVLFTQSPQSCQSNAMLLECCDGAGEQLVSGAVTPERCLIQRESGEYDWKSNLAASSLESTIDEAILARLYDGGLTLEANLGGPQDIEWTIDVEGTLHWLQARPITTTPSPIESSAAENTRVSERGATYIWSNANINENYPNPVTPLLFSIARRAYYHYFKELGTALGVSKRRIKDVESELRNLVGVHSGRLYYNLSNIHAVLRRAPYGNWLCDAFNLFVGSEHTDVKPRSNRASRVVELAEAAWILLKGSISLFRTEAGVQRFEQRVRSYASINSRDRIRDKSDRELVESVESFLQVRFSHWNDASLADAASMISYAMWKQVVNKQLGDTETALHNSLLKGIGEVMSGKPVEQLWQLSRQVRANEELSELFSDSPDEIWRRIQVSTEFESFYGACRSYLDAWGFRCTGELMFTVSSFQDEPESFIALLKNYTELEDGAPAERGQAMSDQRDAELNRFLKEVKRTRQWQVPVFNRASLARRVLRWTQKSVTQRERARYHQAMLYRRFRDVVLELGRRWEANGWLKKPDHVLMLSFDELLDVANGQEIFIESLAEQCSVRRNVFDSCCEQDAPPGRFELGKDEYWNGRDTESQPEFADLRGDGACGGRITGRAVMLRDASELEQMKDGDILVAQQTDPGWAPILFLARGLVMERGGMLSHGAILAREYGIPTVVNVPDATQRIETGMTIRIDGDTGEVEVLDA